MPKGKEQLSVWIPVETKERLGEISRVTGLSMGAIVRVLVESVDVSDMPERPDMARLLADKVGKAV